MEKKIKIYSCRPSNLPSNIEIKQLNNTKINDLLIIALAKKCFSDRDFVDSIMVSLQDGSYNQMLGAFDTETGNLVGACLLIDKAVAAEQKYGTEFPKNHTMFLDFLFVDPAYQHKHIGSNLINQAYTYCGENGFKQIELLCEINNSLMENVYDKNDFLRTGVVSHSNISTTPHYFVFSASVNRNVRQFGKVLYASLLDAYNLDEISFYDYKGMLLDGHIPQEAFKLKNITPQTIRNILNSETFNLFDGVLQDIIDNRFAVMDVTERLEKILKLKKQGVLPYSKAAYNGLGYNGCAVDCYLTSDYTMGQAKVVRDVLSEAKNHMINSYVLEEFRKK